MLIQDGLFVGRSSGRHVWSPCPRGISPSVWVLTQLWKAGKVWQPGIYFFDREIKWSPEEKTDQTVKENIDPAICCAFCRHPVTNRKLAIDIAGGHRHVFTNPGGIDFEIAMFEKADCSNHGIATIDYTWFRGYAWRNALCADCKAHLGWYYTRADSPDFYGLIVRHLVEN